MSNAMDKIINSALDAVEEHVVQRLEDTGLVVFDDDDDDASKRTTLKGRNVVQKLKLMREEKKRRKETKEKKRKEPEPATIENTKEEDTKKVRSIRCFMSRSSTSFLSLS